MRESESQHFLEARRTQLIEAIAEKRGRLAQLEPNSHEARNLKISIGQLQRHLDQIEKDLGFDYGRRAA